MSTYIASILADKLEYFPVLQSKHIYSHAPVIVKADNIDEARGKMLSLAEKEYPSKDGWSIQLSPLLCIDGWVEHE